MRRLMWYDNAVESRPFPDAFPMKIAGKTTVETVKCWIGAP